MAVEVLLKRWVVRESERSVVAEVDARHVPGAQSDYCLICETDRAMRRIWRYPADWHRLEDAKLIALFDQPFTFGKPASADAREAPRQVERQMPREQTLER